jgi:hypothetical protein
MIIKEFNNGWGDDVPLRFMESQWMRSYLDTYYRDSSRTVLINSVWYSNDYHDQVMRQLQSLQPDRIVILSLMDPAIVRPSWYDSLGCEVITVGYCPGEHEIDAWALICHEQFVVDPALDHTNITKPFLCYNRKPHQHRQRLFRALRDLDLLDRGVVTMGSGSDLPLRDISGDHETGSSMAPNAGPEQHGIVNDIMSLGPIQVWNQCLLNVVTETVYDVDREWFVSEKIYKPVLGQRPFLVHAPNAAQAWLDHVGLESYTRDFKDITDLDLNKPELHVEFIKILSEQPASYFQAKRLELTHKIQYNLQQFTQHAIKVKSKITKGIQCPI